MNKRERFHAFARFESVDRVPRRASYVSALTKTMTDYLGADPHEYFDSDDGRMCQLRPPEGYQPPDYSMYYPEFAGNPEFTIDEIGCGRLGHGFHHFTERVSPLRNATSFSEIEQYPYPDNADWLDDQLRATVEEAHAAGDYAWISAGHIYESSWQVRGYEAFLMDLMTQRDWAQYILERFRQKALHIAVAAARAGCDCLRAGDDVANQRTMMFKPDLWREVFKPTWASVFAAAREIKPDIVIWYHSDGNVMDILDDLVEIGIHVLNPVQPECMDPVAVRRRMGKNLAFDGCIGTQSTFPFGSTEAVRGRVHELAESLDAFDGGCMLSPTHVLEPDVPPQNVVAFYEACDELHEARVN